MTQAAYRLDGSVVPPERFYGVACDPRRHVVVEACAGAGKTWMLVARIIRALLDGTQPQEILAITFTRKAAGEMRTRLFDGLQRCARMTPQEAATELAVYGMSPDAARQRAADLIGLYERLLQGGRMVEVRTFHAWYSQLLRAAPFELLADLQLAPGLALVEDIEDLRPELMQTFHRSLLGEPILGDDYRRLARRHGRHVLNLWFNKAIERRTEIELADRAGALEGGVEPPTCVDAHLGVLDADFIGQARELARALAARPGVLAEGAARGVGHALELADATQRYEALREALFTEKGTPRKKLGDLPEQGRLCQALDAMALDLAQQHAHEDHVALTRLSRRLFQCHTDVKRRRGLIDMADLERVAQALLSDHELSGWVQERLDSRIRHLLIDEFQDTSPLQWQALHGWLSAYAGAGGDGPRLFIVGDPKQSIYRFRRAEPRVFEAAQRFVVEALDGTLAACDHTRRCAPGVVAVVNRVFNDIAAQGGLTGWREHTTHVASDPIAGPALRALPVAPRVPKTESPGDRDLIWRASLIEPRHEPDEESRAPEAAQVARAIAVLVRDQGVPPGEIFVLARKREVLRHAAEALAALHLPHVAIEGLKLGDLPEVMDLLAVLDVLASPGQGLSLARALRSPLFGAADDDLLWLARRAEAAGGWSAALAAAASDPHAPAALQRAARLMAGWQQQAATLPPHDLLDRIVHEAQLLPRLAAAVPAQRHARAMQAVSALLACALDLDGGRYASPYAFVRELRRRSIEAPLLQKEQAVQLLTIHGAKGLEARHVFLMEAAPVPPRPESATVLVDWPIDAAAPHRVAFVAHEGRCPPSLLPLLAQEQAARDREEANALYVALTRAEVSLVISRTQLKGGGGPGSWWDRLAPLAMEWTPEPIGQPVADPGQATWVELPTAAGPVVTGVMEAAVTETSMPAPVNDDLARVGDALHRTLEWASSGSLPDRAGLEALARAAARAFGVADVAAVLQGAWAILDSPACRRFFDPDTVAWADNEVTVAGEGGEVRRIDRLVRLQGADSAWWVLDYKLGSAPQDVPAYRKQLGGYRCAVQRLVPGEAVRAAFITGRGELVELADSAAC